MGHRNLGLLDFIGWAYFGAWGPRGGGSRSRSLPALAECGRGRDDHSHERVWRAWVMRSRRRGGGRDFLGRDEEVEGAGFDVESAMRSPVSTMARGPPMADSGAMWRTMVPKAVPDIRASGDTDHVFMTPARASLSGMGSVGRLRACRERADRAGVAEDQNIVCGDVEIGESRCGRRGLRVNRSTTARPVCCRRWGEGGRSV